MIRIIIFLCTISLVIISCAAKLNLANNSEYSVKKEGIISIKGIWLKDKNNKFDIAVQLTNLSEEPIMFSKGNLVCGKGDTKGIVTNTSLEKIDKSLSLDSFIVIDIVEKNPFWTFESNETKQFHIHCKLPSSNIRGAFKVGLSRAYKHSKNPGKKEYILKQPVELLVAK